MLQTEHFTAPPGPKRKEATCGLRETRERVYRKEGQGRGGQAGAPKRATAASEQARQNDPDNTRMSGCLCQVDGDLRDAEGPTRACPVSTPPRGGIGDALYAHATGRRARFEVGQRETQNCYAHGGLNHGPSKDAHKRTPRTCKYSTSCDKKDLAGGSEPRPRGQGDPGFLGAQRPHEIPARGRQRVGGKDGWTPRCRP